MTKKHFIAVAKRLAADIEASKRFDAAEQQRTLDAARYAAHLFADIASQFSSAFDRDRFLTAAGVR